MEDKELFELWENKIKVEINHSVVLKGLSIWSILHDFGHRSALWFIKKHCKIKQDDTILEIGCGSCRFIRLMDKSLLTNYIGLDISRNALKIDNSDIKKIQGDVYRLPFRGNSFKYIISIYNFEHLHKLDDALTEIIRVMDDNGTLIFAIPMEGGLIYNVGRHLTSKRIIEKKYGVDYIKIVKEYEHPNTADKVLNEINNKISIVSKEYLPFFIPSVNVNFMAIFKAVKK